MTLVIDPLSYKMFIIWLYLIFFPINVLADIEATLGLDMKNGTPVIIRAESVFVGVEGSDNAPQTLWCHGSDEWDVCSWVWLENSEESCELIDGTSINECTDPFINIDKTQLDCSITFFSGLNKNEHEGPLQCRLMQTTGIGNFTDEVTANLRILHSPTISLNVSKIEIYKNEEIYIQGDVNDAYPATSISWKIEDQNLLNEPKKDCPQSRNDFCEPMTSVLKYVGHDGDTGKELEFLTYQTDSFGNVVSTQQAIHISIIDDGTNGGGVTWTAGKITGLVIGILVLLLLIVLLILMLLRCQRRRPEKESKQDLVNSSNENTEIVVNETDLSRGRYDNGLVVRDSPEDVTRDYYNQQIRPWPIADYPKKPKNKPRKRKTKYIDPYESEEDEPLVFAWEGFGRPVSPAGSLSSLDSEISHIDSLDLTTPLHNLRVTGPFRSQSNSFSSDTTTLQNATWSDNDDAEGQSSSEIYSSNDESNFNSYSISNHQPETYV